MCSIDQRVRGDQHLVIKLSKLRQLHGRIGRDATQKDETQEARTNNEGLQECNEFRNVLAGLQRNLEIEGEYEKVFEDLETADVEIPANEERLLRAMARVGKSHRMDVSNLSSSLHQEELIDWIRELEDYIELEDIKDSQRVRLAETQLKDHAILWWKELVKDGEENGEIKITRQRVMVARLKAKFIPEDYDSELFE